MLVLGIAGEITYENEGVLITKENNIKEKVCSDFIF